MTEPRWLSVADVLYLHALQVREFGGAMELRDSGLLESAVMRPRQRRHYGELQTIAGLASAYAAALSANHPFVDGNKRVAFFALLMFLRLHGLQLKATPEDATCMMLRLAAGTASEADLRQWVAANV
jgi:death-on-curing protein